jgi:hypothetical protein
MTSLQLYALFLPMIAAVLFVGFARILVQRDLAAYGRWEAEALPPDIQEAARVANDKFIAAALKEKAERTAA